MNSLELEMYQATLLKPVHPSTSTLIMVYAYTTFDTFSVNRLISAYVYFSWTFTVQFILTRILGSIMMIHDKKLIGFCGETELRLMLNTWWRLSKGLQVGRIWQCARCSFNSIVWPSRNWDGLYFSLLSSHKGTPSKRHLNGSSHLPIQVTQRESSSLETRTSMSRLCWRNGDPQVYL